LYKENVSATISFGVDLSQNFHVYEMEWTANSLTSYLDGKLVETKTTGTHLPDLFGKSQHLVLNLAVGGNFFTELDRSKIETGTLYVDWVKVFTAK
jgi:beta-glucanase (GH16 family)